MHQTIDNIRHNDQLLFANSSSKVNEDVRRYASYYRLPIEQVSYRCGYEQIGGERLFIQSFSPSKAKATILLLHGYYDHAGVLSDTIRFLVQKEFSVWTFDLPGHGLSTGDKASIADFSFYVQSIKEIVERYLAKINSPVHLIAHSTGAAAAADFLLNEQSAAVIEKTVLICPLVRSYRWNAATFGMKVLRPFVSELKRVLRTNSSNDTFLSFVQSDPLQHDKVPLNWMEALMKWNESIKKAIPNGSNVLIIQGKEDMTVDWKHNVVFLLKKFPNAVIHLIEGGKHHLLNERDEIRKNIFTFIHRYLNNTNGQ